ncbi:MAG: M20/M25/M40 family metallo-hydrolase [Clostridia bacterium]|nr:M20/M25/M40 family metallo-hydrolase [Clostridia bacterium]
MELKDFIIEIAGLMSVTGSEGYDAAALDVQLSGFDEQYVDAVGNRVYIRRCGREGAPRILIDTHFDEIGMLVTDIKEGGFLSVTGVGGLDARTLASARVRIYGDKVIDGVMGSTPPHLAGKEKKLQGADKLLVDTGYPKEELEKIVRIGTPVGFAPEYRTLAGGRIAGKGFDNKACAAIAAKAMMELPRDALAGDVYLLLSVREETGKYGGVSPAVLAINPDYAMVIDVNLGFMSGADKRACVEMGKGPSLARSAIVDRRLTKALEDICDKQGIPWQISVEPKRTGTNTEELCLVGAGVPTADVGLPLTSMHTYNEALDLRDAEALCRLVAAFASDKTIGEVLAV